VAKARVYELAKELGVDSKTLMNKLTEMGEFVRSASSTIEPPVVRKLRDVYPAGGGAPAPAPKAPAPQAGSDKKSEIDMNSAIRVASAFAQAGATGRYAEAPA